MLNKAPRRVKGKCPVCSKSYPLTSDDAGKRFQCGDCDSLLSFDGESLSDVSCPAPMKFSLAALAIIGFLIAMFGLPAFESGRDSGVMIGFGVAIGFLSLFAFGYSVHGLGPLGFIKLLFLHSILYGLARAARCWRS